MTDSLFLRIKSLNIKTMRGVTSAKSVIRVAAQHNLRELAAELGVNATSGIDPSRISLNYQLRGPDTAAGVAELARALLSNAGVTKLRKDAAMALEIVFSLPVSTAIDHREYFRAAVEWTDSFFNAPILSAAVHLDEASPHMHVLVLPLVAGRMQGGALAGGPAKIRMMLSDFQQQVGQRFGMAHKPRTKHLSKASRDAAGHMILEAIKAHPDRLNQADVRDALMAALGQHHDTLLPLLGLELPQQIKTKAKSFAAIMTSPCKPERSKPVQKSIDVKNTKYIDVMSDDSRAGVGKFNNVYLSVDVAPASPVFSPDTQRTANQRQQAVEPQLTQHAQTGGIADSGEAEEKAGVVALPPDGQQVDRDDEHLAECWDVDRGEFVKAETAPKSIARAGEVVARITPESSHERRFWTGVLATFMAG